MVDYAADALFVYTADTKHLIKPVQNNSLGTRITPVAFETLTQTPQKLLKGVDHVVVAGSLEVIKEKTGACSSGIISTNRSTFSFFSL